MWPDDESNYDGYDDGGTGGPDGYLVGDCAVCGESFYTDDINDDICGECAEFID